MGLVSVEIIIWMCHLWDQLGITLQKLQNNLSLGTACVVPGGTWGRPHYELRETATNTGSGVVSQETSTPQGLLPTAGSHEAQQLIKPPMVQSWVWQDLSESPG